MGQDRWAQEFTATAANYWTAERVRADLGTKKLLLKPVQAAPLLRALGILKRDASMTPGTMRKYMQINHMVLLLEPMIGDLIEANDRVCLLDAGCGKSYLTLLLGWCFKYLWKKPCQIVGIDRNEALIATCRERAEQVGLEEHLRFEAQSIEAFQATLDSAHNAQKFHALISLHACDTATDDAIALGVRLGVDFLAVAPCCQVELSRKWAALAEANVENALSPLWKIPHLRREAAATMTDLLRTLLIRAAGYRVTPMEFVASQHTPKNTLLRAVRETGGQAQASQEYEALRQGLGGPQIKLESLLETVDA
jgi:SAM-dependent methyltransferase